MILTIVLYLIAGVLAVYVITSIIRTRNFSVSDAIASLGIVIAILIAVYSPRISKSEDNPTRNPIPSMEVVSTKSLYPSPTVKITPTPTPIAAGTELYSISDWSTGMNGWSGSPQWKTVNGMMVNDGSFSDRTISDGLVIPPFHPGSIQNYAIEAKMQIVRCTPLQYCGFGVVARYDSKAANTNVYHGGNGYLGGVDHISSYKNDSFAGQANIHTDQQPICDECSLQTLDYTPSTEWHVYRLEVKGNTLKLLIDGQTRIETNDNRFLSGATAALYDYSAQINISSVKIISL